MRRYASEQVYDSCKVIHFVQYTQIVDCKTGWHDALLKAAHDGGTRRVRADKERNGCPFGPDCT